MQTCMSLDWQIGLVLKHYYSNKKLSFWTSWWQIVNDVLSDCSTQSCCFLPNSTILNLHHFLSFIGLETFYILVECYDSAKMSWC